MKKKTKAPAITAFNRERCRFVQGRIMEALRDLEEELGMKFTSRGGKYTALNFVMKLEVALPGEGGVTMTREAENFARYASQFGVSPEHLGATFQLRGENYTLVGLRPRASRFPFLAERVLDQKRFKMGQATVARALLSLKGE